MKLFHLILFLISSNVFCQDIRINEVVASNSIIYDEDGDTPDWIELYNYGSTPVSLINWSISDVYENDNPWTFPNITLAEDEYMLIWASNKNRGQLTFPRTLINQGDTFNYITPNSSVPDIWTGINYNDNSWLEGSSGFGYSDGDDATILGNGTISVFIRKDFNISNIDDIVGLVLDIDYDDGFVAYINGNEIARANINGSPPAYNATTNTDHEAQMYSGGSPDRFVIDNFQDILIQGNNSLSIQAHNVSDESSDLTIIPFLTALFSSDSSDGVEPPDILQFSSTNTLHTDFKISTSGETIFLRNSAGNLVDSVSFENLQSDISIGVSSSSDELVYFQTPTPNQENDNNEFAGLVSSTVEFSHDGGAVNNTINLTLSGIEDGEYIRYTLDSTEPDYTSNFYSNPFDINSTTIVRAKIFKNNYISGYSDSRSYLFDVNHEIPFVSIVSDPYNLFDNDYGIYELGDDANNGFPYFGANFWEDWERPAHFSFYNSEGNLETKFNAGIKIFGAYSRGNAQKSFSFFARGQYGTSEFDYPFFNELNYSKYQSIILRNSGNDWLKSQIRDAAVTSLMNGAGLEYQSHRSIASYVNGEYWGLYNMREKVNEHFIASKANVDPEDVDLLTNNAEIVHGTNEDYINLRNFISVNNLSNSTNYEYVTTQVDIDNFIIYNVVQIYSNNRDWPGNNIKYWKHSNGKWRWILYDTDFSFSGEWWAWDANVHHEINTLAFALEPNGPGWPNPSWSTFMLRNLIQNTEFRNKFVNRYADEMNSRFLPTDVVQHFNDLYNVILDEVPGHLDRWSSNDDPYNYVELMNNFALNRPEYAKEHILEELDLPEYHEIKIENTTPDYGFVRLNNNLKIQELVWSGDYFEEVPILLKAVPEFGYVFSHWSGALDSNEEVITLDVDQVLEIEAHFVENQTPSDLNIVINEINYKSSDDFNADDWIELYNPNSYEIDMSNWVFKDSNDSQSFVFIEGTIILPDDYLIIVKDIDDFSELFPSISNYIGEFDFGLSSSSDAIRIFNSEMVIQDEVYYTTSSPWPLTGNGDGYTLELITPSLDNSLPESWTNFNEFGSPNEINSPTANISNIEEIKAVLWPNPVDGNLNITLNIDYITNYTIDIYDIRGVKIHSIYKNDLRLGSHNINTNVNYLSSGIYFVKISGANGQNKNIKFIKK